jgi:hypothetical protein
MTRLYFDEVTVKTYRELKSSGKESNSYFEIKGKRNKKTGRKSVLLTKQSINDSEKLGEELRKIFFAEYEQMYEVEDYSNKWKWRMTWQNFLVIRLHMKMKHEEIFEKYFNELKIIGEYERLPNKSLEHRNENCYGKDL